MSPISKITAPITALRSEMDVSHLIKNSSSAVKGTHPIHEVEVKPKEQPHISLGNYSTIDPPKGFNIRFTPDPEPDSIVTQITSLGTEKEYELVLHIANYGNNTVSAEVWQL